LDAGLLAYAEAVARLGTVSEVRLIHVLLSGPPSSPVARDEVLASLRAEAARHAPDLAARTSTAIDVLEGPLTDRL
jgi:hypothetical protein